MSLVVFKLFRSNELSQYLLVFYKYKGQIFISCFSYTFFCNTKEVFNNQEYDI